MADNRHRWNLKGRSETLLFLFMATIVIDSSLLRVYGWGNGTSSSQEHPSYGVHDAIGEYAYHKLMSHNATIAKWITDYYLNPYGLKWGDYGYSFGERSANWLGYTDDPDSYYRDWNDHMYEVHGTRRGAPSRIKELYEWTVSNLTVWISAGMPYRSGDEHRAAYAAGLLSHYLADLSQFGHTDYTNLDHSHPSDDPKDDTYHAYYESSSVGDAFLDKLTADMETYQALIGFRVGNISDVAVKMAEWTNLGPNGIVTEYVDVGGSIRVIGSRYEKMLTDFVTNYDSGTSYLDARGYDQALYNKSLELIRYATGTLANVLYSAFKDAEEKVRVPRPAEFTVSDLTLNPIEVNVGEPIAITVRVTNTGELEGMCTVTLEVDGQVEATKDVTLEAGASTLAEFTLARWFFGTYDVDVNGQRGTFVVSPMPYVVTAAISALSLAIIAIRHSKRKK